ASKALHGARPNLALVFASPDHAAFAQHILDGIHEVVSPSALIGCVAEAVIGGRREVEEGPAVSVWLGALPGEVESFHMQFVPAESGSVFAGWRFDSHDAEDRSLTLMICDPFTFPIDPLLTHINRSIPGAVVIGGMASGGTEPGQTVLFQDRTIHRDGSVGVRLSSAVEVHTLVSQGCRPIGSSFVITRAEENVLFELAGQTPLERLRQTVVGLSPPDRELVSNGLHVGRVIDEYKSEFGQGDFLVRGALGADPESGAIAVGDRLAGGETVQLHVRGAATDDAEL